MPLAGPTPDEHPNGETVHGVVADAIRQLCEQAHRLILADRVAEAQVVMMDLAGIQEHAAQYRLAELLYTIHLPDEALAHYRLAFDLGSNLAAHAIGCFMQRRGALAAARYWYERALAGGDRRARHNLAIVNCDLAPTQAERDTCERELDAVVEELALQEGRAGDRARANMSERGRCRDLAARAKRAEDKRNRVLAREARSAETARAYAANVNAERVAANQRRKRTPSPERNDVELMGTSESPEGNDVELMGTSERRVRRRRSPADTLPDDAARVNAERVAANRRRKRMPSPVGNASERRVRRCHSPADTLPVDAAQPIAEPASGELAATADTVAASLAFVPELAATADIVAASRALVRELAATADTVAASLALVPELAADDAAQPIAEPASGGLAATTRRN